MSGNRHFYPLAAVQNVIFMNKIIALFLLFSSFAHSSMDVTDAPFEIPSKEVVYRLAPPIGFQSLTVTFDMSGAVDNEINSIRIETGKAMHVIEPSQLNIDFNPNLNEIRFYRVGTEIENESIHFNIFYGAPKKTECGAGKFEYLQKSVKITVHPSGDPTVERDGSFFDMCKKLTGLEGLIDK